MYEILICDPRATSLLSLDQHLLIAPKTSLIIVQAPTVTRQAASVYNSSSDSIRYSLTASDMDWQDFAPDFRHHFIDLMYS